MSQAKVLGWELEKIRALAWENLLPLHRSRWR
jgi:hypothetical protein